jgi:hypothetical protein
MNSIWRVFMISVLPLASHAALTGVMVFSCDSQGNPAGDFVWDTRGSDSDFYKLWLAPGGEGDGLDALFINGPSWAEAPVNIPLAHGDNQFTVFFEDNGDWPAFGLNLFFDGDVMPAICVKVPLRTGDHVPRFTPNHARITYSLTSYPAPDVPATGRTRVRLGQTIQLKNWSVVAPLVFARDRVDTHRVAPSGRNDYVATFTLAVTERQGHAKR